MNEQSIANNRLIMDFMCWKCEVFDPEDLDYVMYCLNRYENGIVVDVITGWECQSIQKDEVMNFNNWNDLMPVVEKIEAMGYRFDIKGLFVGVKDPYTPDGYIVRVGTENTKLQATYAAIIEFLKYIEEK